MSTQHTTISSIVKNGDTANNNIRRRNPHKNISTCLLPVRVAYRWSLCSFIATVSTAIVSVYSLKSTTSNPMQTIKHCIKAILTTDAVGAVGFPSQGANYAVAKVEPLGSNTSTLKYGKV